MSKTEKPAEVPLPWKQPEIDRPSEPEEPLTPEENPDIIPDEDPFETPPEEMPEPGEGPQKKRTPMKTILMILTAMVAQTFIPSGMMIHAEGDLLNKLKLKRQV